MTKKIDLTVDFAAPVLGVNGKPYRRETDPGVEADWTLGELMLEALNRPANQMVPTSPANPAGLLSIVQIQERLAIAEMAQAGGVQEITHQQAILMQELVRALPVVLAGRIIALLNGK
jgi:endonuclease/exonuclease/phosphatase (EEP) superfamily protein YafD